MKFFEPVRNAKSFAFSWVSLLKGEKPECDRADGKATNGAREIVSLQLDRQSFGHINHEVAGKLSKHENKLLKTYEEAKRKPVSHGPLPHYLTSLSSHVITIDLYTVTQPTKGHR